MQNINFRSKNIVNERILFLFMFLVLLIIFVFIFIFDFKFALIIFPIFAFVMGLILCVFISSYTKCWKYDDEKFIKRRVFIKKTVYYKDIEYFKNETCWDPGYIKHGIKPHLYQKGYFTLTNGKKIEFDISCSTKEFMKMWRKIKRANPKAKLIELPII